MTDITREYVTDPTTGETVAIDPPLQESDAPLMGNSVLARGSMPRKGRDNTALYAGAAIAVVAVLAGGVYLLASGSHQPSTLMTNAAATPPAQEQAAVTPTPAPIANQTPAPSAAVVASAETPEQPLRPARAERAEAARHAEHRAAARAADDSGADTSATVSSSQFGPPPAVATPAPAAQAPAAQAPASAPPTSAPVITPPPSQ
jgi:hypothetical protein